MDRRFWLDVFRMPGMWAAAPLVAQDVPPVLQPWQGRVLHDAPEHGRPLLAQPRMDAGQRECLWPGRLLLEVVAQRARFALDARLDAPGWVPLPGDTRNRPQQVSVDGQLQPVLDRTGHPALRLDAGSHQLTGQLRWSGRPASMSVPQSIASVTLLVSAFAWSAHVLVVLWLIALGLRAGLSDMHLAGNGSGAWNLRWFADRSSGLLPRGGVFSVPLWVCKIAMVAWALWLANALIGWLRRGFDAWSRGGYWHRDPPSASAMPPQLPTDRAHAEGVDIE